MKVRITENDIKKMVAESVKRTILETVSLMETDEFIDGIPDEEMRYFIPAFVDVYGDEARRAISSSHSTKDTINYFINNGTPEQKEQFNARIGEYKNGIDVPADMMPKIYECVNRVVTKRLHR